MEIKYEAPGVIDYLELRQLAGLSPMSKEGAVVALPNSLFAVTLYENENLIGMGRVIGDGGCFFQVVDIAVHPDCQGKGLGKTIMNEIMAYLNQHTPDKSYVSLIADSPADHLYQKYGFQYTLPRSQGMYWRRS